MTQAKGTRERPWLTVYPPSTVSVTTTPIRMHPAPVAPAHSTQVNWGGNRPAQLPIMRRNVYMIKSKIVIIF
jgi:hypothetical protein